MQFETHQNYHFQIIGQNKLKNSLETALSVMLFEILTLFHFQQKSKMAAESGEK